VAALDCIDEALAGGRNIYLHCRAGVGRTGTVLGCYLVRHGAEGRDAIDRLYDLWQQSERSRKIPQIPETDEQEHYVRSWHESKGAVPEPQASSQADRVHGALFGLACGEAVAAAQGTAWGPHTAMTVLLAESLVTCAGNDPDDQMRRYHLWRKDGRIPGATLAVEVPPSVSRALATWQWTRKSYAGPHDPANLDPHTLVRTVAVALCLRSQPEHALDVATEASRTTLQSPIVLDCCRYVAALLLEALAGAPKADLLALSGVGETLLGRALKPEVELLRSTPWQSAPRPAAARTAPAVLSAALAAFAQTGDFNAGLELVLATKGDVASVAALYGALAGAHYGVSGLPADTLDQLEDADFIESVARQLSAAQGVA
jgi:ADP-ribosylglycohydrolase